MGLSPQQMNDAIIQNLKLKTGRTLEEWIDIVEKSSTSEKKEIIASLKEEYGLGHFQAQTVYKQFKARRDD